MAGFRKAKAEQAALKISLYGAPGTGKTLTTLLVAEGLAELSKTRIAYVDTERGTDFYALANPARKVHPEAFDFDALYTRSLTEVLSSVQKLKPEEHGVVVIDSITHLWEAAIASYTGSKTRQGGIPMHAWSGIKRPYKALMQHLINSKQHVFILGRQRNLFEEDENTGETKAAGVGMKAEGETQYEPHICIRMEAIRQKNAKGGVLSHAEAIICAFAEKDRTGTLQGKLIESPNFEKIAKPLLGLLGKTQAHTQSQEEAAMQDSEVLAKEEHDKHAGSRSIKERLKARLTLAQTLGNVKDIGKEITPALKAQMVSEDIKDLREAYLAAEARVSGVAMPNNEAVAVGADEE